jgi:hypothetical protein
MKQLISKILIVAIATLLFACQTSRHANGCPQKKYNNTKFKV